MDKKIACVEKVSGVIDEANKLAHIIFICFWKDLKIIKNNKFIQVVLYHKKIENYKRFGFKKNYKHFQIRQSLPSFIMLFSDI